MIAATNWCEVHVTTLNRCIGTAPARSEARTAAVPHAGDLYNRQRDLEPIYTHQVHAARCREAAQNFQVLVQHVLVKQGLIVYCAVIKCAWTTPDGLDCWTVETSWPERTRLTTPCRNVIQCDVTACSCISEPVPGFCRQAIPAPGFSQAGVVAPPDGLNSENSVFAAKA